MFLLIASACTVSAAERAAIVAPAAAKVAGATSAEWSAKWWQWAMSTPPGTRPYEDLTGAQCADGQQGPVWFLAGTSGGSVVNRTCTVPKGKYIFFPVINMLYYSPRDQHAACDDVRARASANNDHLQHAIVTIDDVLVPDVKRFRARADGCFDTFSRAPYAGKPGVFAPAASDGFWIMLIPPKIGRHHLSVRANYANPDGDQYGGEMIQYFDYTLDVVDPTI
ncbi:MAG: hypothetical protein ABIW82_08395 [Dokdonella sp.]